jgi:LuxR family quorum sensing-dependent transcriptional regulator
MSGHSSQDAFQFNSQLRSFRHVAPAADLFKQVILGFGFDTYACGEVDLAHLERNSFYVLDWPAEWLKLYMELDLIQADPLVDALHEHREPFTLSALRMSHAPLKPASAKIIALGNKYGWSDGFVVPLPHGEKQFGLVTMVGRKPEMDAQGQSYLALIAMCFYSFVRDLVPTEGFAVAPAKLTAREIDCLKLVAQGFSDQKLATSMGISKWTAHEHVESAKRKLKAKSRAEVIAIAASIGVIHG